MDLLSCNMRPAGMMQERPSKFIWLAGIKCESTCMSRKVQRLSVFLQKTFSKYWSYGIPVNWSCSSASFTWSQNFQSLRTSSVHRDASIDLSSHSIKDQNRTARTPAMYSTPSFFVESRTFLTSYRMAFLHKLLSLQNQIEIGKNIKQLVSHLSDNLNGYRLVFIANDSAGTQKSSADFHWLRLIEIYEYLRATIWHWNSLLCQVRVAWKNAALTVRAWQTTSARA